MKKAILLLLLCLMPLLLFASSEKKDYFDYAVIIGQDNFLWDNSSLEFSLGMTVGLTDRLEARGLVTSTASPIPFEKNILSAELSYSLLGPRNTGTKVSGVSLNTLLSFGGFYRTDNQGYGVLVGIDPVAYDCPSWGRRERMLSTKLGWDFKNQKLMVSFSLINLDLYLRGTYRDYY